MCCIGGLNQQRVAAQEGFRRQSHDNAGNFADKNIVINREAGDKMADISMRQAKEGAAAAYAGAGTAIKGHAQALSLNNKATGIEYKGRMDAADITRAASINQAKLQALASVVSAVGNRVAHEIEDGFELRY